MVAGGVASQECDQVATTGKARGKHRPWRWRAIDSLVVSSALMVFTAIVSYYSDVLRTGNPFAGLNLGILPAIPSAIIAVLIGTVVLFGFSFVWPHLYHRLMAMLGQLDES